MYNVDILVIKNTFSLTINGFLPVKLNKTWNILINLNINVTETVYNMKDERNYYKYIIKEAKICRFYHTDLWPLKHYQNIILVTE